MSLFLPRAGRGDSEKRRGTMLKIPSGRSLLRFGAVALMVGTIGVVGASTSYAGGKATITKEAWGTTTGGQAVDRYTLTAGRLKVRILTYGGILQSIEMPD